MVGGELLTKITIWVAVAWYAVGATALALSWRRGGWDRTARLAWTVACAALLAHAAFAFHFHHGWSHGAAYLDTAHQTREVFGLDWGGGLFINYALMAGWVLDVTWWWLRGPDSYRRRWWPLTVAWHGFLLFIFFNATVVFKSGPARWVGLGVCLGVCLAWVPAVRDHVTRRAGSLAPAED
ncbi:MAG TPA: hypothetical protein VD861_14695 [Pyrinomonadaceae bacterium]|nr:hypothetical protein [Pyrinomonadaceae bacterium]